MKDFGKFVCASAANFCDNLNVTFTSFGWIDGYQNYGCVACFMGKNVNGSVPTDQQKGETTGGVVSIPLSIKFLFLASPALKPNEGVRRAGAPVLSNRATLG